jgi:microcompartment protein CcmL/EutN
MKALGFIETMGLLPAIEAADAMLKAAEVRLVDKSLASGGLVTVTVTGEVAAVKAAVDAAAAAVGRIQGARLVARHVIARPDDELEKLLPAKKAPEKTLARAEAAAPARMEAESPGIQAREESAVPENADPKNAGPENADLKNADLKNADKKDNSTKKKR